MSGVTTWNNTYSRGTVHPGQMVQNIGAVLGTIHVMAGGQIIHEGYAERIEVEADGAVLVKGKVKSVSVEPGARADHPVRGRSWRSLKPGEHTSLPFAGPDGWGTLRKEWATAVRALQSFLRAARLKPEQLQVQPKLADDPVEVALDAAMRALMFTDTCASTAVCGR